MTLPGFHECPEECQDGWQDCGNGLYEHRCPECGGAGQVPDDDTVEAVPPKIRRTGVRVLEVTGLSVDELESALAVANRVADAASLWWCEAITGIWWEPNDGEWCGHSPDRGCGWVRIIKDEPAPTTAADLSTRPVRWPPQSYKDWIVQ